jgi:hypothetical protein
MGADGVCRLLADRNLQIINTDRVVAERNRTYDAITRPSLTAVRRTHNGR